MNGSLLIVEEDSDQLEILVRWLTRAGYHVVGVQHPRQALAAASLRSFQVALVDAWLPEMDGLELMRRLKRRQKSLQVVILSCVGSEALEAQAEGAFARLVAPCRKAVLESTIHEAHALAMETACDEPAPRDVAALDCELEMAAVG